MNSREKGKRGEREFAAFLREQGVEARRGQQFDGTEGRDVIAELPGYHFEVKRTEKFEIRKATKQAADDAREGEVPVVATKWNRGRWFAVVPAEEFVKLARLREIVEECEEGSVEPGPRASAPTAEEAITNEPTVRLHDLLRKPSRCYRKGCTHCR